MIFLLLLVLLGKLGDCCFLGHESLLGDEEFFLEIEVIPPKEGLALLDVSELLAEYLGFMLVRTDRWRMSRQCSRRQLLSLLSLWDLGLGEC